MASVHDLFSASTERITIYKAHAPDGTVIWQCAEPIGYQLTWDIARVLNFYEKPDLVADMELPEGYFEHVKNIMLGQVLKSAQNLREYEGYESFPDRIKRAVEAIG